MLKVDNIMRFNLLLVFKLLVCAVVNKFPKAFTFILVYYRNSFFFWPFDGGSVFDIVPYLFVFWNGVEVINAIKVYTLIVFCEVHVAVCEDMIDQ